jgi:hypothetical protein
MILLYRRDWRNFTEEHSSQPAASQQQRQRQQPQRPSPSAQSAPSHPRHQVLLLSLLLPLYAALLLLLVPAQ